MQLYTNSNIPGPGQQVMIHLSFFHWMDCIEMCSVSNLTVSKYAIVFCTSKLITCITKISPHTFIHDAAGAIWATGAVSCIMGHAHVMSHFMCNGGSQAQRIDVMIL